MVSHALGALGAVLVAAAGPPLDPHPGGSFGLTVQGVTRTFTGDLGRTLGPGLGARVELDLALSPRAEGLALVYGIEALSAARRRPIVLATGEPAGAFFAERAEIGNLYAVVRYGFPLGALVVRPSLGIAGTFLTDERAPTSTRVRPGATAGVGVEWDLWRRPRPAGMSGLALQLVAAVDWVGLSFDKDGEGLGGDGLGASVGLRSSYWLAARTPDEQEPPRSGTVADYIDRVTLAAVVAQPTGQLSQRLGPGPGVRVELSPTLVPLLLRLPALETPLGFEAVFLPARAGVAAVDGVLLRGHPLPIVGFYAGVRHAVVVAHRLSVQPFLGWQHAGVFERRSDGTTPRLRGGITLGGRLEYALRRWRALQVVLATEARYHDLDLGRSDPGLRGDAISLSGALQLRVPRR